MTRTCLKNSLMVSQLTAIGSRGKISFTLGQNPVTLDHWKPFTTTLARCFSTFLRANHSRLKLWKAKLNRLNH